MTINNPSIYITFSAMDEETITFYEDLEKDRARKKKEAYKYI